MRWNVEVFTNGYLKMQNYKLGREVKNRADCWKKPIKEAKVHIGL
jgi:hypothetical protein